MTAVHGQVLWTAVLLIEALAQDLTGMHVAQYLGGGGSGLQPCPLFRRWQQHGEQWIAMHAQVRIHRSNPESVGQPGASPKARRHATGKWSQSR